MKRKFQKPPLSQEALILLVALPFVLAPHLPAQTTNKTTLPVPLPQTFLYQGQLKVADASGPAPANGLFELQFRLFPDASATNQVGPTVTNTAVLVSNGLFTAPVNLVGDATNTLAVPAMSATNPPWLEIGVRSNGAAADFTTLAPRQQLLPTPFATHSFSANSILSENGSLVIQRIITSGGANPVIARADVATLEQSFNGLYVRYPANAGSLVICFTTLDIFNMLRSYTFRANNPSTPGTNYVVQNGNNIVHLQLAFGNPQTGDMTQVTLSRFSDFGGVWTGTLISNLNQ